MAKMRSWMLVTFFVVLLVAEVTPVKGAGNGNGNGNIGNNNGNDNQGDGNGNGNTGNGNGNGNEGNSNGNGNAGNGNGNGGNQGSDNGNGNGKKKPDKDFDNVQALRTGQERARCKVQGGCYKKVIVCPAECPNKKPHKNKKQKGCHVDCSSKCEATCKWRKPNCNGYGSLCYDPRFVGGDGVMFYFHGEKGGNFAVVSDENLHINTHFIGTRPQGRTRDYTWVQALSVMFDTNNLIIAAKKVRTWNDKVDALIVKWNGEKIKIPTDGQVEWRSVNEGEEEDRQVIVERTDETNSLRVTVSGLVEMNIKVRPIGKKENLVHNYQLPDDDSFAHLETQFKFLNLTNLVEGILGKTYRPDYVSPVKIGVAMPMMGGEDKYQTPSLTSTLCMACRFQQNRYSTGIATV